MSENAQSEKRAEVRPALEVLGRLRRGAVLDELAIEMNKVVEGVLETGKKGSVVLTITMTKIDAAANGLVLKAEVDGKPPEMATATDVFFADDNYNLFANNPRQRDWVGQGPRPVPRPGENLDTSTGEVSSAG